MLLFTALVAAWFAIQVNKVQKQRAAVAAIQAAGGTVYYDWQGMPNNEPNGEFLLHDYRTLRRPIPDWLIDFVGDEYFQDVVHVSFGDTVVDDTLVLHLAKLPKLETLWFPAGVDACLINAELPNVRVLPSERQL